MRRTNKIILFTIGVLFSLSVYASPVGALFRSKGDPVVGNPKGVVTVVEFFDYECGHCVNMAATMDAIIRSNPDIRVIFKDYPIRGDISNFAARAAVAANKQGKYYEFNRALLTSNTSLTDDSILEIAKSVGLNVDKLKKDMNSAATSKQINNNLEQGQSSGVAGTPAFFIGKTNANNSNEVEFVLGEMTKSELQEAINKAKKS